MDIIITSQESQLKTAQKFVKIFKLSDICLVYLHDKRVFAEDKIFHSGISKNDFTIINPLQIPLKSTYANIYTLYKFNKIIKRLINEYNPKKIYLFGFGTIYNIIVKIGRKSGVEINLIEEGLSQYLEPDKRKISFSFQHISESFNLILSLLRKKVSSRNIFYNIIYMPVYIILFSVKFLGISDFHILIMKILRIYPEFFEETTNFDNAFLAFPEIVKNICAKNFHQINIIEYKSNTRYHVKNKKKILFVSQQYATKNTYNIFYTSIFSILHEIVFNNNYIIDIKLHPRENKDLIIDIFKSGNFNSDICILENSNYNAEEILLSGEYHTLSSISSSTLVYCMSYFSNIRAFSIGSELLYRLSNQAPLQMRHDINELNLRFNVAQYRAGKSLESIFYNDISVLGNPPALSGASRV